MQEYRQHYRALCHLVELYLVLAAAHLLDHLRQLLSPKFFIDPLQR